MNDHISPEQRVASPRLGRVPALDGIRALAIILVVACHVQVFIKPLSGPVAIFSRDFGWSGVYLFFVLSGYLIGRLALSEIAEIGKVRVGAFWARRSLRTWPLYYLALFANYLILPPLNGDAPAPAFWRYLTFTQVFSPMNYFIESWTLCVEEQFYLLLPLFLLVVLTLASPKRIGLICLGVMGLSYVFRFYYGYAVHPGATFDSLFLGVVIAHSQLSKNRLFEFVQRHSYSALVAGIVVLSLAFALGGTKLSQFQGALAFGFGLILVAALNPESLVARILSARILNLIALSSYSTYLTHVAVIKALGYFRIVPMGPRTFIGPLSFLVTSVAVFIVGWLVYKYIEKPGLKLRELLVPRDASRRKRSQLNGHSREPIEKVPLSREESAHSQLVGKIPASAMEPGSIES